MKTPLLLVLVPFLMAGTALVPSLSVAQVQVLESEGAAVVAAASNTNVGPQASPPVVLSSQDVALAPSAIVIETTDDEPVDIQQVDQTMVATHWIGLRRIGTVSRATHSVCQTPCTLELEQPTELRVGGASLLITPDGTTQHFRVRPQRSGFGLSIGAVVGGGISMLLAAPVLLVTGLGLEPKGEELGPAAVPISAGILIGGAVILTLGIIGLVVTGGRFERVDRIEF